MRVLVLDTNYPAFTTRFWATHPELASAEYDAAWRVLMDECFGTADFYSFNLRALGHEASEVLLNDEQLQRLWAREKGIKLPTETDSWHLTRRRKVVPWIVKRRTQNWIYAVARAQIEAFEPDVLYVQDVHNTSRDFLREVKPRVRLIAGQVGSALGQTDMSAYDVLFTLFPHYPQKLGKLGIRARYFPVGFESRVLEKLRQGAPDYDAAFVGGLSGGHLRRTQFLEEVSAHIPFDVWGYGIKALKPDSPLRERYHGEAWGLAMFQTLQRSRVALNIHAASNDEGEFACNMRLYEATGVGSLLLTDEKDNLGELFEVGREVVTFRDARDCADKIAYYLEHPDERNAIAAAGQARTLREHTYARRMEELSAMLEEELDRKSR